MNKDQTTVEVIRMVALLSASLIAGRIEPNIDSPITDIDLIRFADSLERYITDGYKP